MKRLAGLILCILFVTNIAAAQQPVENPDPATREQVLKMMDALQARQQVSLMMDTMRKEVSEMMNQQLEKTAPNAPPEMRAEMSAAMQEMMKDIAVHGSDDG
jgi:ABC-type lipoprotein export system ATPase subunit